MGALDSRPRGVAQHAALAHRQDASAFSTTRTTARSATRRSTPSSTWVDAGAPKGDPKDMPPPVKWADGNGWNYAKQFGGPPDLVIKSPKYTQKAVAQDAWYKPVVETGLTEPRWVRAIEMRPGTHQGPQDHAPRARLPDAGREGSQAHARSAPTPTAAPASSWNGPSTSRARSCAPNTGKLMLPGSKIRLGHPLQRRRRRHHRRRRARHLLLSEGPGAEVPHDAGALQRRHRRQPRRSTSRRTRSTSARTST